MGSKIAKEVPKAADREVGELHLDEVILIEDRDKKYIRSGGCSSGCGACCESIILHLADGSYSEDYIYWLGLHGVTIYKEVEDGHTFYNAHIPIRCNELQEDKTCGVHGTDRKPDMCKKYPLHPMDISMVDNVCTYEFRKIEQGEDILAVLEEINERVSK